MATIKVKLRCSSSQSKTGTIVYQITHQRKTRQLTTPVRIPSEEWDALREHPIVTPTGSKENRLLQQLINSDREMLQRIIHTLDTQEADYTAKDVIARFRLSKQQVTVMTVMQQEIRDLIRQNRLGTARNYQRTLRSFMNFSGDRDISFTAFTERLIGEYNNYLQQRNVVRNTISFYMRILRATYNKVVRKYRIEQLFPFQNVYPGIDRTRKRAIDEAAIARIYRLDLSDSASLSLARDMFIFSYCTRGMAFVDMAYLRNGNVQGSEIVYTRHKTGQQLCIKIEPCIQEIISRYSSVSEPPYLFPILTTEEPYKAFSQYQTALNYYNRQLKRLAKLLNMDHPLSSYTSRHSWATAARKHNVPLSVISAGMGHSSERTTQIYLALLENSVIDTANRKITSALNRVVST